MNKNLILKKIADKILKWLGYEIKKIDPSRDDSQGFTLYRYLKDDGSFDYEKYKRIQTECNKHKVNLNLVGVIEDNIAFLSDYIKKIIKTPKFGICHGTRIGKEQEWFRKYLNCEVIGTEISDTAKNFPYTIQWDFHDTKPEWIDAVDFIYSNSFDHTYDPEKCLNAWMSCINKGGVCIIEHSTFHEPWYTSETDPFGADIVQMPYLILTWGKGRYFVRELLTAPSKKEYPNLLYAYFIVIQRT